MNMWMMGYNDGGDLNFANDSFNGRKLRPLIPRPLSSISTNSSSSSSTSNNINNNNNNNNNPPLNLIHTNDFFSQFHHMATVTDQSKRDLNNAPPPVVVSSRWNPTPEQLRVLEELYRRGTRTPSADQIQHITAQLRRYGKIEGKNVFYWFQNHKARERQKRRRQMESAITTDDYSATRDVEILDRKDSGSGRTVYELEQTKNWMPSSNCSTLVEESGPIQQASKASLMAAATTDCRTENGWIQFEELHQIRRNNNNNNFAQKNNNNNNNNNTASSGLQLIHCSETGLGGGVRGGNGQLMMMNSTTSPMITATTATITTIMHQKCHRLAFTDHESEEDHEELGEGGLCGESETLQLFPLCSDIIRNGNEINGRKNNEETVENSGINTNLTPLQFFEFLPLKN